MFKIIKKMLIRLLTSIVNAYIKCFSLSNQKCIIQPTLINLHPNEYSQKFHYYPSMVKLDICAGNCYTLNDLSNKQCFPNKTEDLDLRLISMITGINEQKQLKSIYHANVIVDLMKENVIQINDGIMIGVDVNVKKIMHVKKIMFRTLLHVILKTENI